MALTACATLDCLNSHHAKANTSCVAHSVCLWSPYTSSARTGSWVCRHLLCSEMAGKGRKKRAGLLWRDAERYNGALPAPGGEVTLEVTPHLVLQLALQLRPLLLDTHVIACRRHHRALNLLSRSDAVLRRRTSAGLDGIGRCTRPVAEQKWFHTDDTRPTTHSSRFSSIGLKLTQGPTPSLTQP